MASSDKKGQSKDNLSNSKAGSLKQRIARARKVRPAQKAASTIRQREMAGAGRALRMVSEFVSAIIVAIAIGFGLDALFGTRPVFLIVLFLMGFAAGVLNVVRAAAQLNAQTPLPDPKDLVPVDKDDDD